MADLPIPAPSPVEPAPVAPAVAPAAAVVIPNPVPTELRQHLDDAVAQIPQGKTGTLSGAVSQAGWELALGAAKDTKVGRFTASGWTGREWGGKGWVWGARGTWSF